MGASQNTENTEMVVVAPTRGLAEVSPHQVSSIQSM